MLHQTEQIATFAITASYDKIPFQVISQLKRHLLDSLGSLLFAVTQPTVLKIKNHIDLLCPDIPAIHLPADKAALYYTSLIRYPDFMDNFLAKESTCHPSDNIGALLAAAHIQDITGKDFLTAMAIAYQVECRLTEKMPVMIKGFDHTALLSFSVTAALSHLLRLSETQAAHALGIAGCSFNPLVTSRASYTREWKGLASSLVNAGCMNIALMARHHLTGPVELFEIPEKGYNAIYDMELQHNWLEEKFDLIPKCILKSYNAEVHSQSALEAIIELKKEHAIDAAQVDRIDIVTFLTCYHIIGGGEYGNRYKVFSKEQADHSLPYLAAAALLDGDVWPEQFTQERINARDAQELLQKVHIHTGFPLHKPVKIAGMLDPYTAAYPEKVCAKVTIRMKNGQSFSRKKEDYKGFFTRPFSWNDAKEKFTRLTRHAIALPKQQTITDAVEHLEKMAIGELLSLLWK